MARIFSGIQPTGDLHLGNYLGAIKNWISLQTEHECIFSVVDLHAMTIPYDAETMPEQVVKTAATLLACGLDPEQCTLYVQSHVREHTELCWVLNTITPLGALQRMTQFKDKATQHQESVHAGLLNYPILQAADILLYKAELVPVGDDQLQHLELTRDLARKFNYMFGETFPEPQHLLTKAPRIMALNDPTRKMSKSLPGSYIALDATPEEIKEIVRKAVTDAGPTESVMGPGIANLFTLLEQFSAPDIVNQFKDAYEAGELRYVDLKQQLADDLVEQLTPIRERAHQLLANKDTVHDILRDGAAKARTIAAKIMDEVRSKVGLTM